MGSNPSSQYKFLLKSNALIWWFNWKSKIVCIHFFQMWFQMGRIIIALYGLTWSMLTEPAFTRKTRHTNGPTALILHIIPRTCRSTGKALLCRHTAYSSTGLFSLVQAQWDTLLVKVPGSSCVSSTAVIWVRIITLCWLIYILGQYSNNGDQVSLVMADIFWKKNISNICR